MSRRARQGTFVALMTNAITTPVDSQKLLRAGIHAARTGAMKQARQLLTQALTLDSRNEVGWLWLAHVSSSVVDQIAALRNALRSNPSSEQSKSRLAPLLMRRGQQLAKQGDKVHARRDLVEASRLQPSNLRVWLLQAAIASSAVHGVEFVKKALSIDPNNEQARRWLLELEAVIEAAIVRKSTVMLVDDSPTIQKLIQLTLKRSGYDVAIASSGMQALATLSRLQVDLILLDINMPQMDGLQLLKILKKNKRTKNIPVMMLTGKDGMMDKLRGKFSGAVEYLVKPITPDDLKAAVVRHIAAPTKAQHE